jgi:hypothetical protein
MEIASFSLMVLYSQIAVFDRDLPNAFNTWTQRHVDQGFAWRSGSVSFGTIEGAVRTLSRSWELPKILHWLENLCV